MARANNSIVAANGNSMEKSPKFSVAITGEAMQKLITNAVPDKESAARFTGSLVSAVSSSESLQACNPATIVAAALRGEGMGLTIGMGYHLIPFSGTCAFVLSYKGLLALAMAGGDVSDMNCIEVRDGEYKGRNRRTKRPEFDFSVYETDEEAEKHPVIGYYAYIEKRDGFFRSEYMTVGEILNHADTYSKAFSKEKYLKMVNGEMTPDEVEKLKNKSPYYSAPDTMFKKTVLRKLLNSGYVPLAASARITNAMNTDNAAEAEMDAIASFDIVDVDASTGEILSENAQNAQNAAESPEIVKEPNDTTGKEKAKKAAQNPVDAAYTPVEAEADEDVMSSFFGE